ncbi:methylated-DNA--[protein]-cysteine S-methyltransferase [Candidatus Tisiphia endosymbiont of Sialis lutaria]|uniref:methylated-DNA--[protein]-cysteine S-methyltransferase n=1 Tax=Candidatus Tisiphia endosymbiont of Sialis lutaria TaxID=2029164 RepID=UPI00312CAC98
MISYKNIAELIFAPKAVRAVANAVARNALSIIVPCHRVIGTDGKLTGYAGGLEIKKKLLELEKS